MSSGIKNADFIQNLASTLANRRNSDLNVESSLYSSSNQDSDFPEYENIPFNQDVQYANGEFARRNKPLSAGKISKHNHAREVLKKSPRPTPRYSQMSKLEAPLEHKSNSLETVGESDCDEDCDGCSFSGIIIGEDKSESNNFIDQCSSSQSPNTHRPNVLKIEHKIDIPARGKNFQDRPSITPLDQLQSMNKSSDKHKSNTNALLGSLTYSINGQDARIYENNKVDDEFHDDPVINKRELKGFMECSRLDRSHKIADSQELWTRYYVFLAEGILSFFEDETDVQDGKILPIETTFLKEAVILMNKPAMNIITVHCINGISYRLSHKDPEMAKAWFSSLKETEMALRQKQKAIFKGSPCISSAGKSDPLMTLTLGPSLSSTIQSNKAKLIQFIKKRVTKNELKLMGIYKEPIFGGTLEAACALDGSPGPPTFLRRCMEEILNRGLCEDGIYRKSGSISAIQNVRLKIDQGIYRFDEVTDVHTLTGVIKLYFRELSSPLIPSSLCNSYIPIIGFNGTNKAGVLSVLINGLPSIRTNTLKHLLEHLRKVYNHESSNRMSMKNLALIFGPTLNFNEEGGTGIGRMLAIQTQLIEDLLDLQSSLFATHPQ